MQLIKWLVPLSIAVDVLVIISLWPALRVAWKRRGLTAGLIVKGALLKLWMLALLAAFSAQWYLGWQSQWVWLTLTVWAITDPVISLIWWWKPERREP